MTGLKLETAHSHSRDLYHNYLAQKRPIDHVREKPGKVARPLRDLQALNKEPIDKRYLVVERGEKQRMPEDS
jgi:hypothetical protein